MSRVLHLDCSSGLSGDMWLGMLIDLGASLETVQNAVDTLGVGDVRITMGRVSRAGMQALGVKVRAPQETPPVRTWKQIKEILTFVALDAPVRDRALATFERIALAESAVHGVAPEDIHFHEVGALDSIADVVGACAAIESLNVDRITCGPVSVGSGLVETAHGQIPVPAPAVTALLQGFGVVGRDVGFELTTPTGAALLAEFATPVGAMPAMTLLNVGAGAGTRDHAHPNILRGFLGEQASVPTEADEHAAYVLEATVDDLSPELVPVVLDRLREAGAHDTWATPVLMKKGRPGYTLHALANESDLPALRSILYRESSTIGSRWYRVQKQALPRQFLTVDVGGEQVRVKVATHNDEVVTAAPEFDDVEAAARATGRAARAIYAEATAAAHQHLAAIHGVEGEH